MRRQCYTKHMVRRNNSKIPKKGDLTNCSNWRGITLLSIIPGKIFIIMNRMKTAVNNIYYGKNRQDSGKEKRCSDNISTPRNIIEQ